MMVGDISRLKDEISEFEDRINDQTNNIEFNSIRVKKFAKN
jgi:hypothetical protein